MPGYAASMHVDLRQATRPGEIRLEADPAQRARDAGLLFIGRVRTPYENLDACPRSVRGAREQGATARLEIDVPFRPGLAGLETVSHLVVLYWLHRSRRDLIVQAPRHGDGPRGVFALRSPVRPNPIGLATARILSLDAASGTVEIEGLDCVDGTPLLDIKPHIGTIDAPG